MLILNSLEIRKEAKHTPTFPAAAPARLRAATAGDVPGPGAGHAYHFRRARRATNRATVTMGTFSSNFGSPGASMAPLRPPRRKQEAQATATALRICRWRRQEHATRRPHTKWVPRTCCPVACLFIKRKEEEGETKGSV